MFTIPGLTMVDIPGLVNVYIVMGSNGNLWEFMVVYIMGSNGFYLLVNVYLMNWKVTMLLMGKSTINKCPFSIAMLNYQRVSIHI